MSTVNINIFPNVKQELNELQAAVLPQGVHPDHLMRRCRSVQVSSLSELKENVPRSTWPRWQNFANHFLNAQLQWVNVFSGAPKPTYQTLPAAIWRQATFAASYNTFRITVLLNPRVVTEELIMEEEISEQMFKTRFQYVADVIEAGLVYALLTERAVPVFSVNQPLSFATAIAQILTVLANIEAGSENFYFMMNPYSYAFMYRQAPPRLGITAATLLQSTPPNLRFVPVASRGSVGLAPDHRIVGYTDYLTKTTTRYYLEEFRINKNQNRLDDNNLYTVILDRWVSYDLPTLVDNNAGFVYTWAASSLVTQAVQASQTQDEINGTIEVSNINFAYQNTFY